MQHPSETEETLVRNYVLFPLVLTVLERDKKVLGESSLKTKEPYLTLLEEAIKKVELDIVHNKKSLRIHGVKVFEQNRTDLGISIKFLYKGYHHVFNPSWDVLRTEVKKTMLYYLRKS